MSSTEPRTRVFALLMSVPLALCCAPSATAIRRPAPEVVSNLRARFCSPIIFMACRNENGLVDDSSLGETVDDALKAIAKQSGCYKFEKIGLRPVLYPIDRQYGRTINDVEVKQLSRVEATDAYVDLLRVQGVFPDLVSMPIVGDDRSSVFRDKVSIRKTGRVVDQMIDLLGSDGNLYLEIIFAPSGSPYVNFGRLKCK